MPGRDDRSVRLFGSEGFARLAATRVAIVGCGGIGTHVAQQLAHLGVGAVLIDDEDVEDTNLNRYVGVYPEDVGKPKVEVVAANMLRIRPDLSVTPICASLQSAEAFDAIKASDWVVGCLDNDGARLVLTELTAAYEIPYVDVASDVDADHGRLTFGGRVVVATGDGCPYCLGEVDAVEAAADLASPGARADRAELYGIEVAALRGGGPAVVFINGVVASLAVQQLMARVAGLDVPLRRLLTFRGQLGVVTVANDERDECPYCDGARGQREAARVERYLTDSSSAHKEARSDT